MKNTKTKIILSAIIFLSVVGFVGTADATGASLYVSPASLTKTAGNVFSASVGFNALGSKVCAIEGTLVFNNLSCQSITVADGVMTQFSPTCSNPYFLIGIPSCTTSDKVLLTVSIKAGTAGIASISATGVDIMGEGASVGSASVSGNYTINAVPAPTSTPTPIPTLNPVPTLTPASPVQPTPVSTLEPEIIVSPTPNFVPMPTLVPSPTPQPRVAAGGAQQFLAAIGNFFNFRNIVLILIIILVIVVILVFLSRKRKNKKS